MEYIMKEKYEILKLAGVLNESVYEKLLEHDLQRGQKVKVSWSEGRRGIIGEIEGVHKIAFPERGKEGRCCFFHFQECIFKFDTKPSDENSGAIIVDPGVCAGCMDLHNLIPHDFEYRVEKNAVFLRYKGKEQKVEKGRMISINVLVKDAVNNMKSSVSFEDTIAKLRSGEIEIPKYPGEVMVPPSKKAPENPSKYISYEFEIYPIKYRTSFVKKIPNLYNPFSGYEAIDDIVIEQIKKTVHDTGGEYLSSDERGYRSYDSVIISDVVATMDFDEWKKSVENDKFFNRLKSMKEEYKNVLEKIELIRNNIHKIVDDANDIQKYKLKYLDFQEDYYNWAKNLPEEQKKLFSNIHNTGSIYNSISSPMEIIFGFELPYRINQSGAYDRNWVQQKDEKYDKWAP
jgi:hypothetical protein